MNEKKKQIERVLPTETAALLPMNTKTEGYLLLYDQPEDFEAQYILYIKSYIKQNAPESNYNT